MLLKELIKIMEKCKSDLQCDFQRWYSRCYDLKFAEERAVDIILSPGAERYWMARIGKELDKKLTSKKVLAKITKDLESI